MTRNSFASLNDSMADDFFTTIYVKSLDGSMLEFSGTAHQMKLSNFKQLVAMKINHKERRNLSADDLHLSIFGDAMDDPGKLPRHQDNIEAEQDTAKTLKDYGVRENAEITRVELGVDIATERAIAEAARLATPANDAGAGNLVDAGGVNPPPYAGRILENVFIMDSHRTYTFNQIPQGMTVDAFFERVGEEKGMEMAPVMLMYAGKTLARGRGKLAPRSIPMIWGSTGQFVLFDDKTAKYHKLNLWY
jgi:hypothetical protein